jgi:hypothetical protein
MKSLSRFLALVLCLAISLAVQPAALVVAQQQTAATTATDYSAPLAAIEKTLDDKRKEFGIPGIALAIVNRKPGRASQRFDQCESAEPNRQRHDLHGAR